MKKLNFFSIVLVLLVSMSEKGFSQSTGNSGVYYGGGNTENQSGAPKRFVFVSISRNSPIGAYGQAPLNSSSGTVYDTYEGKNGGVGARNAYAYSVDWISFKGLENFNSNMPSGMRIGFYNSIFFRYSKSLDWTKLNWELTDLKPYFSFGYEFGPSLSMLNNHLFVNPFLSYGFQTFPNLDAIYTDINNNDITRTITSQSVFGRYFSGGVKVIGKFNGFYATAGFNIGSTTYTNVESYYSYYNNSTFASGSSTSSHPTVKMPNSLFVIGVGVGGAK